MLNKVMIIGRLGRDPELRYTQNGTPVTSLNIATDESYIDREGVRQDRTEWHRVTVFQKQAENCSNYLSKGSLVFVEGSLQTRKWQDQQGQDRYTTEIKAQRVQFLDRRNNNNNGGTDGGQREAASRDSMGGGMGREDYNQSRPAQQQRAWGQASQQQTQQAQPRQAHQQYPSQANKDEDLGPAFPSEAIMDEVPF